MQLPESVQQHLSEEYRFVADSIQGSPDLRTKLFFFSAFYGEASRALNAAWDADLALVHMALQTAYQQINARIGAAMTGTEHPIQLPKNFPQALTDLALELAQVFQSPKIDSAKLYPVLARLAELAYVTTGNGYYLFLRGAIKV